MNTSKYSGQSNPTRFAFVTICIVLFTVSWSCLGMTIDCHLEPNGENYIGVRYKAYLAAGELSETGWVIIYGGNGFSQNGEYQPHFMDLMIKASWATLYEDGLCAKASPTPDATWDNFSLQYGLSDYEDDSIQDNDIGAWSNSPDLFPRMFAGHDASNPESMDKIMVEYQPNKGGIIDGREIIVSLERAEQTYLSQNQNYFMDPDLPGAQECTPNSQANILYRRWRATFKVPSLGVDCSVDFYINAEQGDKITGDNTLNFLWDNYGRPNIENDKFKVIIYEPEVKTLSGGWKAAERFRVDIRTAEQDLPRDINGNLAAGYRKVKYNDDWALEASFGYGYDDYVLDGNPNDFESSNATKALIDLTEDEDPPKPILVDPKYDKRGVGSVMWLDWTDVPGATSYQVQIDDVTNFVETNFDATGVTESRVKAGPVRYSAGWYWRVRATNGVDYSDWSALGHFYTMDMPNIYVEKPLDYVPAYLEEGDQYYIDRDFTITNIPDDLEGLIWMKTANDDQYNATSSLLEFRLDKATRVYVAYDHRATSVPAWLSSQFAKSSYTIHVSDKSSPLEVWFKDYNPGTYELGGNWANGDNGAKSNYVLLFQEIIPPPPAPVLLDPAPNKYGVGKDVWLSWQPSSGATSYMVLIDDDPGFISPRSYTTSETRYLVRNNEYNSTFYWCAKASNSSGSSSYTAARKYIVMAEPPVSINYPNDCVFYYVETGDQYYTDRDFVVNSIPNSLQDLIWIKTRNDDQYSTSASALSFDLNGNATVYVGYDSRATSVPGWLSSSFTKTTDKISVSDKANTLDVWKKTDATGAQVLGGNWANGNNGAQSNYVVLLDIIPDGTPPWNVPIRVKNGNSNFTRTFGGALNATDGFDDGIDVPAPPAGQGFYTFFSIPEFPDYLEKDIRTWPALENKALEWSLVLQNTSGNSTTLSWDPTLLPTEGSFTLVGDARIDMRSQSSYIASGDQTLLIQYGGGGKYDYYFDKAGWYLISLPLDPIDKSVSHLFPSALGGIAYEWDTVAASYSAVSKLEIGKGYWIAIPGVTTATIHGQPVYSFKTMLEQGWYLLGSVYNGADFSQPFDEPNGSVYSPSYGWTVPDGPYYTTTFLNAGEGFWVAVFNRCTLTVGGPPPPPLAASANNPTTMDFPTFTARYGALPPGPPTTSDVHTTQSVPDEFVLHPNYPNPFNPVTTVRFDMPALSRVSIKVYNLQGKLIRTLLDAEKAAGSHQVTWDGTTESGEALTSGIYFIQMKTDQYSKTLKANLIK